MEKTNALDEILLAVEAFNLYRRQLIVIDLINSEAYQEQISYIVLVDDHNDSDVQIAKNKV